MRHKAKVKIKKEPLKIAIGSRANCPAGFTPVTELPDKWPYKDNSVTEVFSHYHLQRIPGKDRGRFMEELYRVLIPGGKATFITPYYTSMRSTMDYRYEWPPISESSYLYFNKGWREAQKADCCSCDFDFTYGHAVDPETANRTQEVRDHWIKHYLNAVLDLQVVLVKR